MQTTLNISQIFFNFTVASAIITLGTLCCIVVFYLITIVKELEKLSKNINSASIEVAERIGEIIDRLSELPILSFLLKRHKKHKERRG